MKYIKLFMCLLFLLVLLIIFFSEKDNKETPPQIPKIFHYVWFGTQELPEGVKQAIQTWKKYQPDFKVKRWNETNCNINANYFIRTNYKNKKFNFASDWCRILALEEGGVYFDTDMHLKKPILPLLDTPLTLTLQREDDLSASFMAVVPNHPYIKMIKEKYNNLLNAEVYSPVIWNKTFLEYFQEEKLIPQKIKNKYHIYHANILMHDFKGGENVAEHLYANANPEIKKSKWFNIFRKNFLDAYAYLILEKEFYLIKNNDFSGYFIDANTQKFIQNVNFFIFRNYLCILYPKLEIFSCKNKICKKNF
ncbi:MAG: hypothetical protein IKV03_05130 [Alphaproteobacteria bacterium]|nr:hypothetical protein [Alphaproteobacteria bacterium]